MVWSCLLFAVCCCLPLFAVVVVSSSGYRLCVVGCVLLFVVVLSILVNVFVVGVVCKCTLFVARRCYC